MRLSPFPLAFAQAAKKTAPAKAPANPEEQAVAAIEKSGGSVRPVAQNDDRKEVSFYTQGASVTDADLAPVAKLSKVAYVHLAKTSVTDAGLVHLKGLSEVEQLHLEGTKITGQGLANLKGMAKLTYLNVYGTAVDDAGLQHLKGLVNLKTLYVWQTKVTAEGIQKLKAALPGVQVIGGPAD